MSDEHKSTTPLDKPTPTPDAPAPKPKEQPLDAQLTGPKKHILRKGVVVPNWETVHVKKFDTNVTFLDGECWYQEPLASAIVAEGHGTLAPASTVISLPPAKQSV